MKTSAQPYSYLFFIARARKGGSVIKFVNRVNEVADKKGNMLLVEKVSIYKNHYKEGTHLLVFPVFFNFPFAFFPLYWIPRVTYTLAFVLRARKLGVFLRPCTGRLSASIMEVYK